MEQHPASEGGTVRGAAEEAAAGFVVTEHTADVGLSAWGATPAAAFVAAAQGMFRIGLAEQKELTGEIRQRDVHITAADWPDLLVSWLAELLGLFEAEGFYPRVFDIKECKATSLSARLEGVALINPPVIAIKAVTYHEVRVDVRPERTDIHVIFDI